MNRDRRNSFGRRLTCVSTSPVPPTADASLLGARRHASTTEAGGTDQQGTESRVAALGVIICRLDEMRQLAASHGLELLSYLLDVAFTESCDAIRKEHSCAQSKITETVIPTDDVS
ncbi:hypothetical protein C9427_31265 [Mesorhizobium helmanticense]|uniref:Uncharacterized protein n=1 Tax=Mesorhizobium helmanticense TaxID=1776423 RepID=A0A2T4ILR0_9HYPH|nr:hypothetical protein C9427_31265 [Mesorhizobium helmanticense]